MKDICSKLLFITLKNYINFIIIYHFYQKECKIWKPVSKSLLQIEMIKLKTNYVIHIRNLKQALNQGLVLKKVHRVIKFSQNALLKPYIYMNTKLRKKAKNNFEKD